MIKNLLKVSTAIALCTAPLILVTSCASSVGLGRSGSTSFASSEIHNSSRSRVDAAVKSVFREEGFNLVSQRGNTFHFQKWGGRSSEIIYGSWFTEGVAVEPEVEIVTLGDNNYAVLCDVYMREHNGASLLDANWQLRGSGKIAYNNLMGKVKKRAEAQ